MLDEFLWVEKYRPNTVDRLILPKDLKDRFQGYVDQGNIPSLIMTGNAGMGKTSAALAMINDLDCSVLKVNGSLEGRTLDVLRNEIQSFASTLSFKKKRKYVLIDEADHLNSNSVQPALRTFMETFAKNCGFILTCNYPNRIIDPLKSRAAVIDFKIPKAEKKAIIIQYLKRLEEILVTEEVEYERAAVAALIVKHFPDFRRILNELQSFAVKGRKIDSSILSNVSYETIKPLIGFMKEKKFSEVRKWVGENTDIPPNDLFRAFYDASEQFLVGKAVPELILIINDHQDKATRVVDPEINVVAFLVNVMVHCEYK